MILVILKKKFLFYFLILIDNCFTLDFNWENEAIRKYSRLKVLTDCLGPGFVQSWKDSLASSTEKCFSEQPYGEAPDLISILEDILLRRNIEENLRSGNVPLPQHPPNIVKPNLNNNIPLHHSPQNPYFLYLLPNTLHSIQQQQQQHLQRHHPLQFIPLAQQIKTNALPQNGRIWKRSATAEKETIKPEAVEEEKSSKKRSATAEAGTIKPEAVEEERSAKKINLEAEWRAGDVKLTTAQLLKTIPKVTTVRNQLGNRISNITCVLKSMELLNENGSPNYSYNTQLINRLNVAEDLRASLRDAQDFCREFSMCVPIHRLSDIIVREVGNSLVFLKCMKKMILQTCIAHDIKKSMVSYDIDLPDLFGTSSGDLRQGMSSSFGDRKDLSFEESPSGVAKNLENILAMEDEVAFGF
ncbi:UNVERIFIED_CONTAM: hypothetical protein RMT77_008121 [Armadillidium vulgare]